MTTLEHLDELTLPAPQTGTPLQRLGVTAQFAVPDGHRPQARRAALGIVLDAYSIAPDGFRRWMTTDDDRPRSIPASSPEAFATAVEVEFAPVVDRPDALMSLAVFPDETPPRWQASATVLARDPRRAWLSTVVVSVPPSAALCDPGAYVGRVRDWAARLRPQYGTAGFALVDELGMAHHRSGAAWPWLQRYPGLDVEPFSLQPKPGRLVTVNWLTVLGDDVLDTLGGLRTVRERLDDAARARSVPPPQLVPYDGGALVQSARLPELGDRTTGDIPASLRAVNAAVRPARFDDHPEYPSVHLLDAPRRLDRRQATLEWCRRFDDDDETPDDAAPESA